MMRSPNEINPANRDHGVSKSERAGPSDLLGSPIDVTISNGDASTVNKQDWQSSLAVHFDLECSSQDSVCSSRQEKGHWREPSIVLPKDILSFDSRWCGVLGVR